MRGRRGTAIASVAVVLAVALAAGCSSVKVRPSDLGDDPSTASPPITAPPTTAPPTSAPTPTTASSPLPTPTTAPSPLPTPTTDPDSDGDGHTSAEAQVRAFVRGFIAADNHASATGDYRAWDALVSDCRWCARKRAYVTKIYDGGGRVEGELFTKVRVTTTSRHGDVYVVHIATEVSAYTEFDGSGAVIDEDDAAPSLLTLAVKRLDGRWKVVSGSFQRR